MKQVRYLIAVADAGSFTAGARRAFVTQSTLSSAIAALEAEIGCLLFERRARGVTLTAAGTEALSQARKILRLTEELKSSAKSKHGAKPLRIGILPTLPARFAADAIAALASGQPGLEVRTETAPISQLDHRLAVGRYDAVLSVCDSSQSDRRERGLMEDALALAFPASKRPGVPVTPESLHENPLIVRTHCEMLLAASRILDRKGIKPRVIAKTGSDEQALAFVAAGLGACLMPNSFRHDGVEFHAPAGVELPRRIGFQWLSPDMDPVFAGG